MSRIFDSSHLTQRKAEKAIAGAFLMKVGTAPNNMQTYGSKPLLGIKDSSILYAVKSGQMTQYTRFPTCIEISPGCPCNELNAEPFNPNLLPGLVSGITFTVGSIIVSWVAPTTGTGPFTYTVTPYLNGVALPSVITANTTYRFTDLQEMQPYTFTISAVNAFGNGVNVGTPSFVAPPSDLPVILSGSPIPPVDASPSLLYIINAGLDHLFQYAQGLNVGPTIISRIMYLWVASVVQAWNWVTVGTNVSGIHDNWNWDTKAASPLSNCDAILFICSVVDYVTPLIVPGGYVSIYNCNADAVARVQTAGQWSTWLSLWSAWFAGRQSDGAAAAITTMPTGSANWNSTIVVDGVSVNNIAAFPQPQQWTRLTVQGHKQGYLTYTWDNVTSSCLSAQDETDVINSVAPVTGADRDAEIDAVIATAANLTDAQKVQAEFWAGSAAGTISPPLMCAWLWKEYIRSIGVNCDTLMYSLLDLAVHLFEGARLTWKVKGFYMQDRPIQEIRRRYTGQAIASWNGTVDGSQWIPYQRANFVTPPFPDFTSGHSNFTKCLALTMTKWFGSTITKNTVAYDNVQWMSLMFGGAQSNVYGDFLVSAGSSTIQPGQVPAAPVTVSFSTWDDIATSAGLSRVYGGIHTINAHTASQTVAVLVDGYVNSTWNIQTF